MAQGGNGQPDAGLRNLNHCNYAQYCFFPFLFYINVRTRVPANCMTKTAISSRTGGTGLDRSSFPSFAMKLHIWLGFKKESGPRHSIPILLLPRILGHIPFS